MSTNSYVTFPTFATFPSIMTMAMSAYASSHMSTNAKKLVACDGFCSLDVGKLQESRIVG